MLAYMVLSRGRPSVARTQDSGSRGIGRPVIHLVTGYRNWGRGVMDGGGSEEGVGNACGNLILAGPLLRGGGTAPPAPAPVVVQSRPRHNEGREGTGDLVRQDSLEPIGSS